MTDYLRQENRPSVGVKAGSVSLYAAHSTPMGNLMKTLR